MGGSGQIGLRGLHRLRYPGEYGLAGSRNQCRALWTSLGLHGDDWVGLQALLGKYCRRNEKEQDCWKVFHQVVRFMMEDW